MSKGLIALFLLLFVLFSKEWLNLTCTLISIHRLPHLFWIWNVAQRWTQEAYTELWCCNGEKDTDMQCGVCDTHREDQPMLKNSRRTLTVSSCYLQHSPTSWQTWALPLQSLALPSWTISQCWCSHSHVLWSYHVGH